MSDPKNGGLCEFSLRCDGLLPLPIEKREELFHFTIRSRGALTFRFLRDRGALSVTITKWRSIVLVIKQQNGFISYWKIRDRRAPHAPIERCRSFLVRNRGAPPILTERKRFIFVV